MDLWPLLLALAIVLNLVELVARKGLAADPGTVGLVRAEARDETGILEIGYEDPGLHHELVL